MFVRGSSSAPGGPSTDALARFTRAAVAIAASRLRRRHLRSALGPVWLVLAPGVMFFIYWLVFGHGLKLTWRAPGGPDIGYFAPFAVGYAFYLFLADCVGSAASGLAATAGLWRRGGVPRNVVVAALGLESLARLAIYLSLVAVIIALAGSKVTPWGMVAFLAFGALFVLQAQALSFVLLYGAPLWPDLAEVAPLGLRVFIYAAGVTFPLTVYPTPLADVLRFTPLSGPLNGARDALLLNQPPQSAALWVSWIACAVAMTWGARLVGRRLSGRVADIVT